MSTVKSKKLQVGTDASASNNFTIYQPSTPDGTLRIGVGNADSPTEVGRFTSAGYKPTTAPMFRAYNSSAQSISNNTFTKVQFQTESWDTNSNYDNATNYRFQPTVAGYYYVTLSTAVSSTTKIMNVIYKNGAANTYSNNADGWTGIANSIALTSDTLYLNGSTDYIEGYIYQSSGGAINTQAISTTTFFSAHLIQQA